MEKYKSPFPDRKINGQDFTDLVKHVNLVLEKNELSEDKINELLKKIKNFNKKNSAFEKRLENFYSKQIELFGLFIAIFSFIIAGIQIAANVEGTFIEKLATSAAIFIPLTLCIVVLFVLIRNIIKK
ncbi:hypothetical protein [Psychroserpens sp. S379A]|uniref:hypothetical protein n=1 Tax=Psychroserpens sp. S379A TaxID=3415137 RepID=UPI003C7BCED5